MVAVLPSKHILKSVLFLLDGGGTTWLQQEDGQ